MNVPVAASILLVALLGLAACGGTTGPGSPSPGTASQPAGPGGSVESADEAARLAIAADPRFAGLELQPQDPDMIGGCCWYEAHPADGGYEVVIVVGWGDCPSGCINEHRWAYAVTTSGEVTPAGETGDPVPPGPLPPSEGG
jgi:hypothetical protein